MLCGSNLLRGGRHIAARRRGIIGYRYCICWNGKEPFVQREVEISFVYVYEIECTAS
jgi:hypothetical protein